MKYYKASKFSRPIASTGFYAVIICCLLALGAAGWFAVSKYNDMTKANDTKPKNSIPQSYSDNTPQYNSNTPPLSESEPTPSENVNEDVSDVPYEDAENNEIIPDNTPEESTEERSFVIPIIGNILKGYSDTALQYSETFGDMRIHQGVDIACEAGSEIVAAGAGTVTTITDDSELGKVITIDHGNGIIAKYCGFESSFVNEGDSVSAGNPIGAIGTVPIECADGSHIHIEVLKDGKNVSPFSAFGLE